MVAARLFVRLFDDASMFPPGSLPAVAAMQAHRDHLRSWYATMVGGFVCGVPALDVVAAAARTAQPVDVSLVVGAGFGALPDALGRVIDAPDLRVAAVELPIADADPAAVRAAVPAEVPVFAEAPVAAVDDAFAGRLHDAQVRLKLRTGGTAAAAFPSEPELGAAIGAAVRAGLAFKCTAGLHHALRHTDPATGFEHHGFLNVLAAVDACLRGDDPLPWLAERDGGRLAAAIADLSGEAVRSVFLSFGTCSVAEPVGDLIALGLVAAPVRRACDE